MLLTLQNMVKNQSFFLLFIRFKYIPKHSIEGTQRPTKIAWSEFPLKNKISEYTRESIAATNSSLSVKLNFLYILFYFKINFQN